MSALQSPPLSRATRRAWSRTAPAAEERALALVGAPEGAGQSSGIAARLAFVPLRRSTLLDALALDQRELGDDLADALRRARAVPQRIGIDARISSEGVVLRGNDADSWVTPAASVAPDGAVTIAGSVAVEGQLGLSAVDPERLRTLIIRAAAAAQLIFERIDGRGEVVQVAVAAAIHGAAYKGYGVPSGNSTHVSMSLPEVVIAPAAEIAPRAQLADPELARRIEAAIKRIFADAGALQT